MILCSMCGAPLVNAGCPRCSYKKPVPRKEIPLVYTAPGAGVTAPFVPLVTVRGSAPDEVADNPLTLAGITVAAGESLFVATFTNGTTLLSIPAPGYGGSATWNGIGPSGSSGLWGSPADVTEDVYSLLYWNRPTPGTGSVVLSFDAGDDATRRTVIAFTVNVEDNRTSGIFTFPPSGPSTYMSYNLLGTQTETNQHTATTDFSNAFIVALAQTHTPFHGSTEPVWQNGFTRIHREGTDAGTADIVGDIAYKLVASAGTDVQTKLSGFDPCRWGLLTTQTRTP